MTKRADIAPSIVGDVPIEKVTVNRKGGSLTAILKKSIRGGLEAGAQTFGARIDFEPDVSCVLVAPGAIASPDEAGRSRKISIRRVSASRYIIDMMPEGEQATIDPVTHAALRIMEEKLKEGSLNLQTLDEFDEQLAEIEREADKLLSARQRKQPVEPSR